MEIVNISDYRNTTAPAVTVNRFARPMPIKIDNIAFVDETPTKKKNAAEPIKDAKDIYRVRNYFIDNGRLRDNLIFIMGINFGLRCGDLLRLKIGHILNTDTSFKQEITIKEEKTDKFRTCYMNDAVMDAAELYLCSLGSEIDLNSFLFKSRSNNNSPAYYETMENMVTLTGKPLKVKRAEDASITVFSVERMLKKVINEELGINIHAGTHLLRKTFAYHMIMSAPDRSRAIEFLQKILGHSSQSITLAYAGITSEEIKTTCQNLNLGGMDICYSSGFKSLKAI